MRQLTEALDVIMLSRERRPAWKIEIFDIRSSTGDTINDIVRDLTLEAITGPRDFTSDVMQFDLNEQASDFASTGVSVPSLTLQVASPDKQFDPFQNAGDDGRWLRRGNVVRLYEGDTRVDDSLWPATFTGTLVGQAGVDINRTGGGRAVITVKALGREKDFIDPPLTSEDFGVGTSLNSIGTTIAQTDMGLDADEIDWISWGAQTNGHLSLQFVELPPLVAIANLMMVDGLMPRFNGEGKLTQTLGLVTQSSDRVYTNQRLLTSIVAPFNEADPVNSVLVVGLDTETTKISQEMQDLTELHVTTGYFTQDEEIPAYFTDDHRGMADNIVLEVVKSANGGLSFLGGGESFTTLPAPLGTGSVGVVIEVATGFAPYIIIFLTAVYVTLAAIPDIVTSVGVAGQTIPVGRVVQAVALAVIMLLMTKIGKAHYILRGEPFEYVYLDIRGKAEKPGLTTATRVFLKIENQVIQTQADADQVAMNQLFRQQALAIPRAISMLPDLALEPDDVFEIPATALTGTKPPRQFQVQSSHRTGRRSAAGEFASLANLGVSELTDLGLE